MVTVAARERLWADAFNESFLMRPGQWLTRGLVFFDNRGVDGTVNGLGAGLGGSSSRLRRTQTGFVRSYALSMLRRYGVRARRADGGEVRMTRLARRVPWALNHRATVRPPAESGAWA